MCKVTTGPVMIVGARAHGHLATQRWRAARGGQITAPRPPQSPCTKGTDPAACAAAAQALTLYVYMRYVGLMDCTGPQPSACAEGACATRQGGASAAQRTVGVRGGRAARREPAAAGETESMTLTELGTSMPVAPSSCLAAPGPLRGPESGHQAHRRLRDVPNVTVNSLSCL